jgi:low affinity Fe/Cu permease
MWDAFFSVCSRRISAWVGSGLAFGLAAASVLVWAGFGPATGYSDDWMLVINTGTTIVTFLMVFLIQNAQNRDTTALQVKLDELIRATKAADNLLIDIEDLTPEQVATLRRRYSSLAKRARELGLQPNGDDAGGPEPDEERATVALSRQPAEV